jgi:hypothetical protein
MSANDSKPVSRVELENMQISLVSKVFGEADLLIARIERLRDDFPRLLHWEGKAAELEINRAKKLAEDLRSAANGFATKVLDEEKRQKAILSKYADGLIRDWRNEMHDAAAEAATRAAEKAVVKPITKATDAMARMLGELDEVKLLSLIEY